MLNRLKRLKIKHQLAIAGGLVAIPMVVLVGRDIVNHAQRIEAAQGEVSGLRDLTPYIALLQVVPRHRALLQMRLGGERAIEGQIESLEIRIDDLIAQADSGRVAQSRQTPLPVNLGQQWADLRDAWREQSVIESAGAHAQMMDAVAEDMDAIAHRSGLLPSRTAESYGLARLVVRTFPEIIALLDDALALEQAQRSGAAPSDDDTALELRFFALDLAGTRVNETLSAMTPGGQSEGLNADLAELAAIQTMLEEGRASGMTDERLVTLGQEALEMAHAIHQELQNALAEQLASRIAMLQTHRNAEVAALVVALALIGLLLAIIGSNITRAIGRVVDICRQLGAGRYDQPLTRDVGGDMGVVIGALGDLQDELARERQTRQQAEHERERLRDQFVQSQKMEALGTLAGGIAHDFNNVIAAIIGQAELAMFASQSGRPIDDRLERVVQAGLRAKAVVQQILSFAKQETTIETEPVSPAQFLRETVDLVETGLQEPVSISMDIDDRTGPVQINPSQCHQLLLNVLVNAGHAIGDTGAPISCGVRPVDGRAAAAASFTTAPGQEAPPQHEIWTGELSDGPYANFWIADGGGGMEHETLVRIYDPFFTTRTDGKGSGLGLSAAQGIVLKAGGAIHVGTTPGIGTRFDIFLPIRPDTAPPEPAAEAPAALPAGTARILLVDDNGDALEAVAAGLRLDGYSVDAHTDGAAALAAFETGETVYDLVVTDHNMPSMTGLDLAAKIHALQPGLPVILSTGRIDAELRARAREAGISAFVEKPFQTSDLAAEIRRTLNEKGRDGQPAS